MNIDRKDMTDDEVIEKLTQYCEELLEIAEGLKEENEFLAETIIKHNMGEIIEEREELLTKMKQNEDKAEQSIREANEIKLEYKQKNDKLIVMYTDARTKQANLDFYIDDVANRKIADIKQDYHNHKIANDKALEKHIADNDMALQEQLILYKKKRKKLFLIAFMGITIGIIGIIINFI